MFDGFFPQALHDVLYKNILLGFLPLIPVTQESTLLLQTIESHVADSRARGGTAIYGLYWYVPL